MLGATLAVALAYFVLGQLSLRFIQEPGTASIVWLPTGLAVASIWWLGWRGVLGSALGVALLTLSYWSTLTPLTLIRPLGTGIGYTLVWILLKSLHFNSSFPSVRDLIGFILSLIVGLSFSASWQTLFSLQRGIIDANQIVPHWLIWFGGDLIGGLLLGTLLLGRDEFFRPPYKVTTIMGLVGFGVLAIIGVWVAHLIGQERNGLYYLLGLLPLLILVAYRYEKAGTIVVLNGMLGMMVIADIFAVGSYSIGNQTVYDLWVFLIIAYMTTMTIAVGQSQQRRFNAFMEQSRAELEQAYQQLEAIIENSPTVAIQGYDFEGRVVFWNRASERFYGFRAEEAVGKTLDQLIFTSEETQEYLTLIQRIAESGEPAPLKEWEIHTASGEKRYILSSLFPVQWRDQKIVICADIDITERKQLEAQLLQAQKMESIGRLAGGIAHDFNNLLTVIQGFAELAQSKLPAEHPAQTDLERIMQAVEKSASLTRQLLAFAGRAMTQPTPIDVHRVVQEMVPLFQRTLGEKVRLETDLRARPSIVKIDPSQLEQVLMNLVVNARDAMPEGGTITILSHLQPPPEKCVPQRPTDTEREFLCLSVQDTGVGISEEDLEHIFEPFYTTKGNRGHGLGLATVYGIVAQHGGCLSVESQRGHGTTFHIYLPLYEGELAESEPPMSPHPVQNLIPLTILLVEDEPEVRESAATALQLMGYSVISAGSVEEALQKPIDALDILVSDVVLPDRTGYDLAQEFAKRFPEMRCLFVTGYAEKEPPHELPVKWAVLSKPFRMEQLQKALQDLLSD